MRNPTLALLLAALPGCPDSPKTLPEDPDAAIDANATSSIRGTVVDRFVSESGTTNAPRDLSGETIAAYYIDAAGSAIEYAGTGAAEGTFEIPDVPDAGFVHYVRMGHVFVVTDERELDLGQYKSGRADATAAADGTALALAIDGMTAWQDTDHLELVAPNAGAGAYYIEYALETPPAGNDTALGSALDYVYAATPSTLIDAAKDDVVTLAHITSATSGATSYQRISEIVRTDQITLADGASTPFVGTFTAVAADQTGTIDVPFTQFRALAEQGLGVAADSAYAYALVDGHPHGDAGGQNYGITATIAQLEQADAGIVDVDAAIAYANPYADFDTYGTVSAIAYGTLDLGGGVTASVYMPAGRTRTAADFLAGEVAPTLGPPSAILANGNAVSDGETGIGLTPTISWTAPTLGAPDYYRVNVFRLDVNGTTARYSIVASIATPETSATIPPGILESGQRYLIALHGFDTEDVDFAQRPFIHGDDYSFSGALTGVLEP